MKVFKNLPEMYLDKKELNTNLGNGNTIFVGSSCDMFANKVDATWIWSVIKHCEKYDNKYLFQTKNPARFDKFYFPAKTIFGTTLETNREYMLSDAPSVKERYEAMKKIKALKMVSIEPILNFDLYDFSVMIRDIKPAFVSIGADSKGHNLPEPSPLKVTKLIKYLEVWTEVKIKDNLKRLICK
jgi:DNA repair photolyase